jgi:class 3 adenylate cyclase
MVVVVGGDEAARHRLRLFVSYRRDDTSGHAGRLYDRLVERFGADRLFIDIDTIRPGADFAQVIDEALERCDVLLALVGRNWLKAADRRRRRRLDNPDDFVRLEIEAALRRGIPILPVLLQGAEMPSREELPPSLGGFARRQAFEVSDRRWNTDVRELIEELGRLESDVAAKRLRLDRSLTPTGGADTVSEREAGTVTYLLTDVVGFTALWELAKHEMAQALVRHDELVEKAVRAHGGELVRPRGEGDSRFAVFVRSRDAVLSAAELVRALREEPWPTPAPLAVRVAVHVGEGELRAGDYYGPAVNRTARLRAVGHPNQVLLTAEVAHDAGPELPDGLALRDLGEHRLRDVPDPVRVYQLLAPGLADEFPPLASLDRAPHNLPRPMSNLLGSELEMAGGLVGNLPIVPGSLAGSLVGRDAEQEIIESVRSRAAEGHPQLVLIGGEPGIGKTRLAVQMAERAAGEGAVVLYGRCDEELGVPYQPMVQALSHLARNTPADRLHTDLGRYPAELVRLVPEISELISDLGPPLQSDPETERYRLFDAVASWLESLSRRTPVVLVLDDLQWAVKPTLLMLRHLLGASDQTRLLILGTYRDTELGQRATQPLREFLADTGRMPDVKRILLDGLDEAGVVAFLEGAAGHQLDEGGRRLARTIGEQTGGNPYYVSEIVRLLVDSGDVVRRDGRWVADVEPERLNLPEGVREVIARRVDRLGLDVHDCLSVASVIGLEFDYEVLLAAGDLDEDRLCAALEEGCRARLLVEAPGLRFRFAHSSVQTTLYEELSSLRRVRLHRAVGYALEKVYAARLDDHLAELAHHFSQAVVRADVDKAVDYGIRAGSRALGQLAPHEALRWLRGASELLERYGASDDPRWIDVLLAIGRAHWSAGEIDVDKPLLARAAGLARLARDAERLAEAALAFAGSRRPWWLEVGDVDKDAVGLLEEALEACPFGDSGVRVRLLGALGRELYFGDDVDRREQLSREAVAMARRLGDPATLALALVARHSAGWTPDNVQERLAIADEIALLADRLLDEELALAARTYRLMVAVQIGDRDLFDREIDALEQGASEVRLPFYRWLIKVCETSRAIIRSHLDRAEALALEALELGSQAQEHTIAPQVFGVHLMNIGQGRGTLAQIRPAVEAFAAQYPKIPAWRAALLTLASETGEDDGMRAIFEDLAVDDFARIPRDWLWHVVMFNLTRGCVHLRDRRRAAVLYELLAPYAGQHVVVGFTIQSNGPISAMLGQLSALTGDWERVVAHFEDALAETEEVGSPGWNARTRYEYACALLDAPAMELRARATPLLEAAAEGAAAVGWTKIVNGARALLASADR